MRTVIATLSLLAFHSAVNATIIYTAEFSIAGEGATHSGSGTFAAGSFDGANWTSSWPTVNTDGTTNSFITVGGNMTVSEWGGNGTLLSDTITFTSDGDFTFSGTAITVSSGDAFNALTEGFEWFYILNSGSEVSFGGVGEGFGGSDIGNGVDLSDSVSGIAVSSGDTLEIGFNFNVDGSADGFDVSSMTVDFNAIPEPSIALFSGLGLLRRRR